MARERTCVRCGRAETGRGGLCGACRRMTHAEEGAAGGQRGPWRINLPELLALLLALAIIIALDIWLLHRWASW